MKTRDKGARQLDEHEIGTVTKECLEVKEDVQFSIRVSDVSEVVVFALAVWDPDEQETVEYPVDVTLELALVYKDKAKAVQAFLTEQEGAFDPADFAPGAVAKRIMDGGKLFLEAGGTEMNAYFSFGSYGDMVSMEREEAERFVVFDEGDGSEDE
ncbi:MAG: hypothetical protein WC813_01895 [Patescibacteria group bacterium]|jgi:hypothetical protein